MAGIGIIRCEKNEKRCPLTGGFKAMASASQGFVGYEGCEPMGVLTCRCPGDGFVDLAKILKAKGAEAIHVPTCTFAHKEDNVWEMGGGFCDHIDDLVRQAAAETGILVVKGTAHLPGGYQPERFEM